MDNHWTAVTLSSNLKRQPLKVVLNGAPIVLFRSRDTVGAVADRCPHRLAELSKGRVIEGTIECPYHGWRFNKTGQCTAIPGHLSALPRYRVQSYKALEHQGAIFVSSGAPVGLPYAHGLQSQDVIVRRVQSTTQSTVIDAAENILDATHTHFTHKGLLRGLSAKRHKIKVEVTGSEGRVEATYTGEPRQEGVVSKLLEGARSKTVGRFLAPGIAELEYWGPKGLVLITSFHLHQSTNGIVKGVGWLVGPKRDVPTWIKAAFFKPLFRIALAQDRRILKSTQQNALAHGAPDIIRGPLDFLRGDIEAIMDGKRPPAADHPRTYEVAL